MVVFSLTNKSLMKILPIIGIFSKLEDYLTIFEFHKFFSGATHRDSDTMMRHGWSIFCLAEQWIMTYAMYWLLMSEQLWILSAAIFKGFLLF